MTHSSPLARSRQFRYMTKQMLERCLRDACSSRCQEHWLLISNRSERTISRYLRTISEQIILMQCISMWAFFHILLRFNARSFATLACSLAPQPYPSSAVNPTYNIHTLEKGGTLYFFIQTVIKPASPACMIIIAHQMYQ